MELKLKIWKIQLHNQNKSNPKNKTYKKQRDSEMKDLCY